MTPQEFEPLVGKPRTRLCWLCGRKFKKDSTPALNENTLYDGDWTKEAQ